MTKRDLTKFIKDTRIMTDATEQNVELGFMALAMVQATLPHREVKGDLYVRKNGFYTLTMQANPKFGLPYGSIPRVLLAWLTTEVVLRKTRELELGQNLTNSMEKIGMTPTGGTRGTIPRFKDQVKRLFGASVSATYDSAQRTDIVNRHVADNATLCWEKDRSTCGTQRKSIVVLSEAFYQEVVDNHVPINLYALAALTRSPLAMDIYCWLTYRASYIKTPSEIPWNSLAQQVGANYGRLDDFRSAFISGLEAVRKVYPDINVEPLKFALIVRPAKTHIKRRVIHNNSVDK